jgi:hypothetical protein
VADDEVSLPARISLRAIACSPVDPDALRSVMLKIGIFRALSKSLFVSLHHIFKHVCSRDSGKV